MKFLRFSGSLLKSLHGFDACSGVDGLAVLYDSFCLRLQGFMVSSATKLFESYMLFWFR